MSVNPARPTLPIGWPLLPEPDADGSLNWPTLDASIRQTIRVLLVTEPGERLLHPRLGAALQQFVHHPNTVLTRRRIRDRVGETLAVHEPRIQLTDLSVAQQADAPATVVISIAYTIRMTGQAEDLSLALELGG